MLLFPLLFAGASLFGIELPGTSKGPRFPPSTGVSALYGCADGRRIEVLYSGGDVVVVTIGGKGIEMKRAISADGERYVGGGWQWWSVGTRRGTLAPLGQGEEVASAPGTACTAK